MNIIEKQGRIHGLLAECIDIECEMLNRRRVQLAAVLALKGTEWHLDDLWLLALGIVVQINLKIFTIAIELADQLLTLTIRDEPEFHSLAG